MNSINLFNKINLKKTKVICICIYKVLHGQIQFHKVMINLLKANVIIENAIIFS